MAAIGRQALSVLLPVKAGREGVLEAALATVASPLSERLRDATSLHFARLVVLPGREASGCASACLLLETTYDGELGAHVAELFACAGAELTALFRECDVAPADGGFDGFEATLRRGSRPPWAFATLNDGLGVEAIRNDARIRERVLSLLERERSTLARLPPLEILRAARSALGLGSGGSVPTPAVAPPREPEDGLLRLFEVVPLVLGMLLHDVRERLHGLWHDRREPWLVAPAGPAPALGSRAPQRAFTHLAVAKPGRFRRSALRRALGLVGVWSEAGLARRAPGVHALRFVLLDDGRLLFTHQQDGSLTSRLAGLGRQARALLALVWSSTEGFPRALLRHLFGNADDERWLEWLRARELRAGFAYSAYPTLTARDVAVNAEIRALLGAEPSEARARRLLELV
jgi:hypothetical protein